MSYYSPEEMHKFSVKAGVTGLAQINGRGLLSWGETLKWDLEYVRTRSVFLDLKILFLTFWNVVIRRGRALTEAEQMQRQPGDPQTPFVFTNWELFEPLKRHKSFILVFTLSAALSALGLTYIYSEKYEGDTTILFKPTEVTRLRDHTDMAFGAPLPQAEYKVIGKTIEDLANSRALLEPVVKKLKLDIPDSRNYTGPFYYVWYKQAKDFLNDEGRDIWSFLKYGRVIEKTNLESAMATLGDNIDISNKDSYVFELKVRDKHQERVAQITNAVADELVLLLQQDEQQRAGLRSSQIKKLMDAKREEITSYQTRMADTLNSNSVVSVSQEADKGVYRYSELALASQNNEADLHDTEATLQSYDQGSGGNRAMPAAAATACRRRL